MQAAAAKAVAVAGNNRIYICPKCNKRFDKFDEFNNHTTQGSCKEAEKKAYCIAFKGSECISAQKRVNFTVDDYYYGHVDAPSSYKKKTCYKKFTCYSCGKVLRNNIRFMSHVRHKLENEWKDNDNVNDFNICSYCYRHYTSPFHLQCHVETVHATVPAATTCRICELNFENEQVFLMHMKDRHTYNEMPYICKLCSFRSSFYHELTLHFRLMHENTNSLLCPFCLAIHQTANSYLTHVVQHMSKSVRCTKCRLQFFNSKDKTQHAEADHKSVFTCTGKKGLPKNPNQYMIFVKVSHHPLSPTKSGTSTKKSPQSKPNKQATVSLLSSNDGWTFSSQYDPEIPLEYRPFARESRIFVVLSFEALRQSVTNCIECGENLGVFVANYNKHFQREYRCRKCSFSSRCYKAIKKHILVFHLKQEYDPTKDVKPEDPIKQLMKKTTEPSKENLTAKSAPALSQSTKSKGDLEYVPSLEVNLNEPSGSGLRRSSRRSAKSSANTKKIDELIQADIDALTDSSGFSGDEARTSTDYPSKTSTLNKSSSPEIKEEASGSASQKRSAKKRKITDINSLLMMKEQEQESERASKQRRKQSKPQKVNVNQPLMSSSQDSADSTLVDNAVKKENVASSVDPPPLDDSFLVDDLADEPKVSKDREESSDRDSPPKLKVKFASHLGLSKKNPGNSPAVKPFVNPRSAAHVFPPLPNLLTTSSSLLTSSANVAPPSFAAPSVRFVTTAPMYVTSAPKVQVSAAAPTFMNRPPLPISQLKKQVPVRTTRKSVSNVPSLHIPRKTLPFGAQIMGGVPMKKPNLSDLLNPPRMLSFSEVTNSSFLVSWIAPASTNLTEFKLVFQGAGLPTTQRLPAEQTSVRLIGLRSNTLYLVQLCSVYRFLQSANIEGVQRTLGLREQKTKRAMKKIDEVIVLDDEDEDACVEIVCENVKKPPTSETATLNKNISNNLLPKVCDLQVAGSSKTNSLREQDALKTATSSSGSSSSTKKTNDSVDRDSVGLKTRSTSLSKSESDPVKSTLQSQKASVDQPANSVLTSKSSVLLSTTSENKLSLSPLPKSGAKSVIVVADRNVKVKMIPAKPIHNDTQSFALKASGGSKTPDSDIQIVDVSAHGKSAPRKIDPAAVKKLSNKTIVAQIEIDDDDDNHPPSEIKKTEKQVTENPVLSKREDVIDISRGISSSNSVDMNCALSEVDTNDSRITQSVDSPIEVRVDVHHCDSTAVKNDKIETKENVQRPSRKGLKCLEADCSKSRASGPVSGLAETLPAVQSQSDIFEEVQDKLISEVKKSTATEDVYLQNGVTSFGESGCTQNEQQSDISKKEEDEQISKTKESATTKPVCQQNGVDVEEGFSEIQNQSVALRKRGGSTLSPLEESAVSRNAHRQEITNSNENFNNREDEVQSDILGKRDNKLANEAMQSAATTDVWIENDSNKKKELTMKNPQNIVKLNENNSKKAAFPESPSSASDVKNINMLPRVSKQLDNQNLSNHVQKADGLSIAEKVRLSSIDVSPAEKTDAVKTAITVQGNRLIAAKVKKGTAATVDMEKQTLSIQDLDNILSFLEEAD